MAVPMRKVLKAWALSEELHQGVKPGVSAADLATAEKMLGRSLPAEVRELYSTYDGGEFMGSNLNIWNLLPTPDEEFAFTTAGRLMRSWHWPIPDEVAMFGGDGSDGNFGLWLPKDETARNLAIEFAEAADPDDMAIVGDDLASFLAARTACLLVSFAFVDAYDAYDLEPALNALDVPIALRAMSENEADSAEGMHRFLRWASPNLPDPHPDPFKGGLTAERIAEIAQAPDEPFARRPALP